MDIDIQITNESIPGCFPAPEASMTGAWVEFRGIVRGEENGVGIGTLEYEAYSTMAETEMRRILQELSRVNACLAAKVIHRIGIVPVGEAAIYLGIAARHRKPAFAMLEGFMDRLKQDVPIWKCRAVGVEAAMEAGKA